MSRILHDIGKSGMCHMAMKIINCQIGSCIVRLIMLQNVYAIESDAMHLYLRI